MACQLFHQVTMLYCPTCHYRDSAELVSLHLAKSHAWSLIDISLWFDALDSHHTKVSLTPLLTLNLPTLATS